MSRSFHQTLRLLITADARLATKKNGAMNVTAVAKSIGVKQPTLKRWLDGELGDPESDNAAKLCRWFDITRDQLTGAAPIPWIDQSASAKSPTISDTVADLTSADEAFQRLMISIYWAARQAYSGSGQELKGRIAGDYKIRQPAKKRN